MCSNRRRMDWEEREYRTMKKYYSRGVKIAIVWLPILMIALIIAGIVAYANTKSFFVMVPFLVASIVCLIGLIINLVRNRQGYNEKVYEKMKRSREGANRIGLVGMPILFIGFIIATIIVYIRFQSVILAIPFAVAGFICLIALICCAVRSRR